MLLRLVDLVFPSGCAACDGPAKPMAAFCPACAEAVEPMPDGRLRDLSVTAAGVYGGSLSTAVVRLKFGERPDLAHPLGGLLASAARRDGAVIDTVVPVPLHRRRLVARGYNQAALLARAVGHAIELPVDFDGLRRVRGTAPQTDLDAAARVDNVRGAFEVVPGHRLAGRRVGLVDDVVTTGATAQACADALVAAGAASVAVLAVARVP
jgi:ComF family protein